MTDEAYHHIMYNLRDYTKGARTSVAIRGEKGMGKTTLLKQVYNDICKEFPDFAAVFIEAGKTVNAVDFVKKLGAEISCKLEFDTWQDQLSEIMYSISMTKQKYVIIIDDVHLIEEYELIASLRGAYQIHNNLFLIFGLDREHDRIVTSYAEPFFAQLQIVDLGP